MYSDIMSDAAAAFPALSLPAGTENCRGIMALCADIYRGEPPWAYVKKSGLYGRGERRMSLMGCAKVLCDRLAALTFSSQADIYCGTHRQQEYVNEVLRKNSFWENMPAFFSRAYAMGGGVLKVYVDRGQTYIDYVDADCFIPMGSGPAGINAGIFRSRLCKGGVYYTLLEHQSFDGHVSAERALFSSKNGGLGRRVPVEVLFDGLDEKADYPSLTEQTFAYFRPAGANNLSDDPALGLSCFANCIDTLRAIDVAFDSFAREFVLGRKRIIVPSSCIRTVVDPDTGNVSRYFDTDDEVYQALKCDEEKDLKITDNTAQLRVSEHVEALNALLDMLCFQTGLSAGMLSFSTSGLKTATEIRSMETRTEITMQQNRYLAAELIEKTVRAVIACGIMTGNLPKEDIEVRVAFSDRQTVDRSEIIDRNIRLVDAGLRSRVSALTEILECSEEEAAREIEKADREKLSHNENKEVYR